MTSNEEKNVHDLRIFKLPMPHLKDKRLSTHLTNVSKSPFQ